MKKKWILLFLMLYFSGLFLGSPIVAGATEKAVLTLSGKKQSITNKTVAVHLGDKDVSLSYLVRGRRVKIKGTWSTSNSKIVKIDKKGRCKAVGNGTATIRFTYKIKGKKTVISTKIFVLTRPSKVSLSDSETGLSSLVMKPNESRTIKTKLYPADKALKINAKIKSNYKVFYELFSDEACTRPTDLGIVDSKGNVIAKEYGGTIYLRAEAKPNSFSKSRVLSNVFKIAIDGLTKEQKEIEDERARKEAEEALARERLKPARIEIEDNAPAQTMGANSHGLLYANVYFKVYDGNGKEITNDPIIVKENLTVFWNDAKLSEVENGKATVVLLTNIPGSPQNIGTQGNVGVKYKDPSGKEVTATKAVRISPPGFITKAEIKGIYRYAFNATLNRYQYEAVLDVNEVRIKKGDKIGKSANHIMINSAADGYYLLLDVTDNYNKFVTDAGLKSNSLSVVITGKTGIEIDESEDLTGKREKQSIRPVQIDGRQYLTYPLKAGEINTGELQIVLQGGYVRNVFTKTISDGTSMSYFILTGQAAEPSTPIQVGKENVLEYLLYNSKGESVKDYAQVLYHLKLTDTTKSGVIYLPLDSAILSSAKNSLFRLRKNPGNNQAEIIYTPQMNILISGNPLFPISEFGEDEITVLRGFGENFEKKIKIYVRKPQ